MPVRPRRQRRDLLTLERDLLLSIGPRPHLPGEPPNCPKPGSAEWELLRQCFEQHRGRWGEGTWGYRAFGPNADPEAALAANRLTPADP